MKISLCLLFVFVYFVSAQQVCSENGDIKPRSCNTICSKIGYSKKIDAGNSSF